MKTSLSCLWIILLLCPARLWGQTPQRPGVYVQEITSKPAPIVSVETRLPVFIGYTEKLPPQAGTLAAVQIDSYAQYERLYGGAVPGFFLAQSVRLFFENHGTSCYLLPVGLARQAPSRQALSKGLARSAEVEAQLVLIPDAVALPAAECHALQNEMIRHCTRQADRFAILNTPRPSGQAMQDFQAFRVQVQADDLSWAAVYYPWLISQAGDTVPPAGAIAGVYAQTDTREGVWKAPANVALKGIAGLTHRLSEAERSAANVSPADGKSINVLATFAGRGTLVWGSRTLAGNDNEWRYVPVRRFATMLEQSLRAGLNWVVFEPNDEPLWTAVETAVSDYLLRLWRAGAFPGSTPRQAYFVKCGLGQTMTAADIQAGKLILEIGFAPTRPAEFGVLRLEWTMP